MPSGEEIGARPHLSILAMISFIASFMIARIFTTLNPKTVLIIGGLHIHHFWFGLAFLAVGGWLGISYRDQRIDRVAAILFGAGGGLIGDEVGLLLTLGNYWTGITYTFVIILLTFVSMLILVTRYSRVIRREFSEFLGSNASFYVGVFLAAVSIAFILETDDAAIIAVSSVLTIVASVMMLAYLIRQMRKKL